jgi:CubicO group peptidase (beta-lactamase class C family)
MLLNGLLATATGKSPRAFAQERLFGPIGVEIRRWTVDRAGLETGGSELYLTARDMLRFGLLYLAHGSSRGRQIIPVAWVDSTLAQYVRFESPPADAAARMLPGGTGYGLMWWHRQSGARRMSCAWGTGGQLICLVPELDLAVVLLSTLDGNPPDYYARLFELVDRDMVGAARP